MAKLKSSVPGMNYPSARDDFLKTAYGFIDGRRKDDGAEGLWRIYDNLYDLESFIKDHPGGSEWLEITRGTDITEAFECHHITDKAERLLSNFFIRKAVEPRALPYTFEPNGFYRKFKKRVGEALKDVDFHHPTRTSKIIADAAASVTVLSAIAAVIFKSYIIVLISGLFLAWTAIIAHNFFHMRDNFRMYYFDLSLMSSKEWRISHALSHHLYPNTLWDYEVYVLEPFLKYLPTKDKSLIYRAWMLISSPFVYAAAFLAQGIKRYYSVFAEWKKVEFRDAVPFFLPIILSFFGSSIFDAMKFWLYIMVISSLIFAFVGVNAAHHHPDIFHDGDECRKDIDWGLMELDAVRDRKFIDDSIFLVLTTFGSHGLHHMLPTVDHSYLPLCWPALVETCREFDVDVENLTPWELIVGQYRQLTRTGPRANYRGAPTVKAKTS